jgi:hypothetical protein
VLQATILRAGNMLKPSSQDAGLGLRNLTMTGEGLFSILIQAQGTALVKINPPISGIEALITNFLVLPMLKRDYF